MKREFHEILTGILDDFNFLHSSSSKQQACPILWGRKSSILWISSLLGIYKH